METECRKCTKRQRIGVLLYRDGPSSFEDEKFLLGEKSKENDSPKGLNEYMPHSSETNKDILNGVAGSEVLIVYFAKLGASEVEKTVDLDYVDLLLKSGANVNFQDAHGQTVMHEVALHWPVSLAIHFFQHNADLNHADTYGRTPLHVATSVNCPEMVKWLVSNGADIHARTKGEEQTPIHFAAKYNAEDVIPVLMELGAGLGDRDYKERTPMQLAAETGREEAVRTLLEAGASAGVYDDTGTSCLTHLISNMPDVAASALEQFHRVDKASKTVYYYLSYLETYKWEESRAKCEGGARMLTRREPLEAIIKSNETRLIMHPVVQRLIIKKRQLYGSRYFLTNLLINFIFTFIWTVLTYMLPKINVHDQRSKISFYDPLPEYLWRIVLEIIGLVMALYFVLKMQIESGAVSKYFRGYKLCRIQEIRRDLQYCHPRWPQEESYLRKQLDKIEAESPVSLYDAWYYMDMISFLGLVFVTITRFLLIISEDGVASYANIVSIHYHAYPFVLIVIWLRFMQSFRPFITLGPFIAMLGYVVSDTLKFAFLFCEFYIPYCCAIWIVFGGPKGKAFAQFYDLMFEVFRMAVVDSFVYDDLTSRNKVIAQIICGTYFALVSITCLNLYIALLSETFARVFGNATATAYMLQGEVLMNAERKMNVKTLEKFKSYIARECSPEAVYGATEGDADENGAIREIMSEINNLKRQCGTVKKIQTEMRPLLNFLKNDAIQVMESQRLVMEEIETGLQQLDRS